mmetsp:Transcript_21764/g.49535  ORF Transcript_21764/g.49535 Transcript_21764/m.49535 type:complete len:330 (+) Transcript_21764:46-1035(+)
MDQSQALLTGDTLRGEIEGLIDVKGRTSNGAQLKYADAVINDLRGRARATHVTVRIYSIGGSLIRMQVPPGTRVLEVMERLKWMVVRGEAKAAMGPGIYWNLLLNKQVLDLSAEVDGNWEHLTLVVPTVVLGSDSPVPLPPGLPAAGVPRTRPLTVLTVAALRTCSRGWPEKDFDSARARELFSKLEGLGQICLEGSQMPLCDTVQFRELLQYIHNLVMTKNDVQVTLGPNDDPLIEDICRSIDTNVYGVNLEELPRAMWQKMTRDFPQWSHQFWDEDRVWNEHQLCLFSEASSPQSWEPGVRRPQSRTFLEGFRARIKASIRFIGMRE